MLLAGTAILLPTSGRGAGVFSLILATLAVLLAVIDRAGGIARAATALLIGALPALVLVGAIHDLPGVAIPIMLSRLSFLLILLTTTALLGVEVTRHLSGRRVLSDVWSRVVGVAAVTAYIAGALVRLLLPEGSVTGRLAWIILEEDNAQIVGVAREILVDGPRGAELADQYGTAFASIPLLLMRLLGGPLPTDTDVRLQAITAFTVSTIIAILMIGLALALLVALPHHVHRHAVPSPASPAGAPSFAGIVAGGAGAAAASLAAMSLLVVLPMRTGFLTLVWGLALVLTGSALVAITPTTARTGTRLVLITSIAAAAVLLLSSWPFIITALLPALALPLTWVRWEQLRAVARRDRTRATMVSIATGVALLAGAGWFLRWGPAAEVLSYGRGILLITASGIYADTAITWLAFATVGLAALLALRSHARAGRPSILVAVLGPIVGAGSLYLGLRVAAAAFTSGELNYSGIKLLYAIIALAVALGLTSLVSQAARTLWSGATIAGIALVVAHTASPTVSLHTEWWDRTDLDGLPHVSAVVDAIANSSSDLPVRCLPPLGTPVTSVTQWAAYFCVRWVEDALNDGRFNGRRSDLLDAEGPTFDATIEAILADHPSEYSFAYRMQMGFGWFGWYGSG